jgi:hypothetical protein
MRGGLQLYVIGNAARASYHQRKVGEPGTYRVHHFATAYHRIRYNGRCHCSVDNYAWFSIGEGPRGAVTSTKEISMTIFVEFFALSMIFILCVLVGIDQWSERHQYYAAADPSFLDEAYPRDEA